MEGGSQEKSALDVLDIIFTELDETLTANKALSGQFKGTLQFNKSFFTIANYTVASGHTLTVTDSADLYAVGIASGTKMIEQQILQMILLFLLILYFHQVLMLTLL